MRGTMTGAPAALLAGALAAMALATMLAPAPAQAADGTRVGEVSTTFRVLGRNDKVVVDRYDDPKVDGVSCYLSHAETGGVKGSLGLAVDPSRFSIACRATGPVAPKGALPDVAPKGALPDVAAKGALPDQEVVFGERSSLFFKELRVSRIVDRDKRVLVYLAWSTRTLSTEGSPYNAVSVVPMP